MAPLPPRCLRFAALSFALFCCCKSEQRPAAAEASSSLPLPALSAAVPAASDGPAAPGAAVPPADSCWKQVPDLPPGCTLWIAQAPVARCVAPLAFVPCAGSPLNGCQSFVASWNPADANTFFGRFRASFLLAAQPVLVSKRREYDAQHGVLREVQSVDRIDGSPVFALAVDSAHSRCFAEIAVGEPGIAVTVASNQPVVRAWLATSTWERPQALAWRAISPDSLSALGLSDGALAAVAYNAQGVWTGDSDASGLYRPGSASIAPVKVTEGKRTNLGIPLPWGKGAYALLSGHGTEPAGVGYIDEWTRFGLLRRPDKGGHISEVALDPSLPGALVWTEGTDSHGTALFTSPIASPTALKPREVAKLPMRWFEMRGDLTADHRLAAFTSGREATRPPAAFVVRLVDGLGWSLPAPEGRWWSGVAGLTDRELWLWTSTETRVGANGLVRVRLDGMGDARVLL